MSLNNLGEFIQVLYSVRKHYTKVRYFPKHILFIIIYLLQEQYLNYRNYSGQEIIMSNFVQAIEYDMILYENFQCMNMHLIL
jgi:hypothetical protein